MATKVIKFNDGSTTYVAVTVASAVQYSYNGGVMSVQDALGTVVSAVVGYLCIKYFLIFVSKFSLKIFAYYCVIVGAVLAVFFNFMA